MGMIYAPILKLTPSRKEEFLHALRATGDVDEAAQAIDSSPGHLYHARARDPEFRAAWLAVAERLWHEHMQQHARRARR